MSKNKIYIIYKKKKKIMKNIFLHYNITEILSYKILNNLYICTSE